MRTKDWHEDFDWQKQFTDFYAWVIFRHLRFRVADWEADAKRNTDLLVAVGETGLRVACRARRSKYRDRYAHQFTVRLDRPSGVPSEMAKLRDGWGDFGLYGFEVAEGAGTLSPFVIYNLAMLRQYLDDEGLWYRQRNRDLSSTFAAFDLSDVESKQLGFVIYGEGHEIHVQHPAIGPCRFCDRDSWLSDADGPMHPCCRTHAVENPGKPCLACEASAVISHKHWGWP